VLSIVSLAVQLPGAKKIVELKERGGQREPLPKALWDSPDLRLVDEGRALRALSNFQTWKKLALNLFTSLPNPIKLG
jgi:hypothetical protein